MSDGRLAVRLQQHGPIPLDVEGDKVTGNGTTFYQFILPLEHSAALQENPDEQTVTSDIEANTPASTVPG